jgi:DsbC/DsbD-like thiol-disulfide interchange protein
MHFRRNLCHERVSGGMARAPSRFRQALAKVPPAKISSLDAMTLSSLLPRRVSLAPCAAGGAAILCVAFSGVCLALVPSSSPWVKYADSKARLDSGTSDSDGKPALLAGVQLRMAPGWKTYWRSPGDSGVPPSFDWKGSVNLKSAEVLFPAPHRFDDAGGTAIGYGDEVIFPVKIVPEREDEPIVLKLTLDYGLCKDLCIPNSVNLDLALPPDAISHPGDAVLLEEALARVPKPAAEQTLPALEGVEAKLDAPEPKLIVDVLFPPKAMSTDLFIDAGETFVSVPKPLGPPLDGRQRFSVGFADGREAEAIKGKTLTLTLVSDLGSTETTWTAP